MTADELRAQLERSPKPVCAELTPFDLVIKAGKSLAFAEAKLLLADGRPAVTATPTLLVPSRG